MKRSLIIAVDFDGTCVEHDYHTVGMDVEGAAQTLRRMQSQGHRLILHTMRSGELLEDACRWFERHDIKLWGVNRNPEQRAWTESPKVYADYYIDDAALGCPIMFLDGVRHHVVDWAKVEKLLKRHGVISD
jgi:hypothetical protein